MLQDRSQRATKSQNIREGFDRNGWDFQPSLNKFYKKMQI